MKCLSVCVSADLYGKEPVAITEGQYSCRLCFFWEPYQHGTVTLVISTGWLGAVIGQCVLKLVSPVSTRSSTVMKKCQRG